MWKRRTTLDQEREQKLSSLLQVNFEDDNGGVKNGIKWSGEMAEEPEQELSCFQQVELRTDGGMNNGERCVNGLHEECRKELPTLFKVGQDHNSMSLFKRGVGSDLWVKVRTDLDFLYSKRSYKHDDNSKNEIYYIKFEKRGEST
jgi:hypothetical protein